MIRLGVVGLNNQGRDHIDGALGHPEVCLAALCDTSPDQIGRVAADVSLPGGVRAFTTMEEMFASGAIDAAAVCLPHDQHADAVRLAVRHRLHLLKEKPLGRTLREAHEVTALMRKAGLVLHTGVQRRHHPTYAALKEQLEARGGAAAVRSARVVMTVVPKERALGLPVVTWRSSYDQAGGGALIDLGYHGVDLAQFLLGPLELVACSLSSDAAPQAARTVEEDASVWALAGTAWLHLRFGRASRKEELVALQLPTGILEADREVVRWVEGGCSTELFRADRSWRDAMIGQLSSLARAIRSGDLAPNDLATQVPALRFIEACAANASSQGLPALEPL